MPTVDQLKIKIFADGADMDEMISMYSQSHISGLTTNPTLMRKAGVLDYPKFCLEVLQTVKSKPISFEVFSDDFGEMEKQAEIISGWGENVYVKIPVTNTKGEASVDLISTLSKKGVKLNVTAIMTEDQVKLVTNALRSEVPSYISIFAGRIADTGVDPIPLMKHALELISDKPAFELIWASPRELLNIFQGEEIGCHIITVTTDILKKLSLVGYDLNQYSLDTVKMFYKDALTAGYSI